MIISISVRIHNKKNRYISLGGLFMNLMQRDFNREAPEAVEVPTQLKMFFISKILFSYHISHKIQISDN